MIIEYVWKKGIFTDPFCSSGRDVRWYDPARLGGGSLIGRRGLYTDDGGGPGLAEMSVHPCSRRRVCPPPGPKGGGAHSPAAKGVGGVPIPTTGETLSTLPTLWLWGQVGPKWHLPITARCNFTEHKKVSISRAQPSLTCPNNGSACIKHITYRTVKIIGHRWFYVQDLPLGLSWIV